MKKGKGIKSALKSTGNFIKKHKKKIGIALATAAVLAGTYKGLKKSKEAVKEASHNTALILGAAALSGGKHSNNDEEEKDYGKHSNNDEEEKDYEPKVPTPLIYTPPPKLYDQDEVLLRMSNRNFDNRFQRRDIPNHNVISSPLISLIGNGFRFKQHKVRKSRR